MVNEFARIYYKNHGWILNDNDKWMNWIENRDWKWIKWYSLNDWFNEWAIKINFDDK